MFLLFCRLLLSKTHIPKNFTLCCCKSLQCFQIEIISCVHYFFQQNLNFVNHFSYAVPWWCWPSLVPHECCLWQWEPPSENYRHIIEIAKSGPPFPTLPLHQRSCSTPLVCPSWCSQPVLHVCLALPQGRLCWSSAFCWSAEPDNI